MLFFQIVYVRHDREKGFSSVVHLCINVVHCQMLNTEQQNYKITMINQKIMLSV